MALEFDPDCQRAIDRAKSARSGDEPLDAALLLAALCHTTDLARRLPRLAGVLPRPEPKGPPPGTIALAPDLRSTFTRLASQDGPIRAVELFRQIAESPPGRAALSAIPPGELDELLESLSDAGAGASGAAAPPSGAESAAPPPAWRSHPDRPAVLRQLAE